MLSALDFDEGYFLQVVWNLWHHTAYRSFYQLLDPYITTGPTVILPASLFIPLHPLAPRIIMLIYLAGFGYVVYRYYLLSLLSLATWILVVVALPHAQTYLTHVLGEIPGLFFVIAGYAALQRKHDGWAGILFGLGILTKQIYVLALVPVLLTRQWKAAGVALIPAALWHMIVYTFGSGDFEVTRALAWPRPDMLSQRFSMISSELWLPWWVWLLASYAIWTCGAHHTRLRLLSMFSWTYGTYYLLLYSNYSYRTLFPLLVATLLIGVSLLSCRHALALLVTVSIFSMIFHPQEIEIVTFSEQAKLAHLVRSLKGTVSSCGWYSAPELSYLAGRRIDREVSPPTAYYITTVGLPACSYPPFPAKRLSCNAQHCVYQKL